MKRTHPKPEQVNHIETPSENLEVVRFVGGPLDGQVRSIYFGQEQVQAQCLDTNDNFHSVSAVYKRTKKSVVVLDGDEVAEESVIFEYEEVKV